MPRRPVSAQEMRQTVHHFNLQMTCLSGDKVVCVGENWGKKKVEEAMPYSSQHGLEDLLE